MSWLLSSGWIVPRPVEFCSSSVGPVEFVGSLVQFFLSSMSCCSVPQTCPSSAQFLQIPLFVAFCTLCLCARTTTCHGMVLHFATRDATPYPHRTLYFALLTRATYTTRCPLLPHAPLPAPLPLRVPGRFAHRARARACARALFAFARRTRFCGIAAHARHFLPRYRRALPRARLPPVAFARARRAHFT